jgi:antitoxin component of MazEF toxin-antitoxin module
MQIERTLKKVGGSVMLPIPPEMLREMQLGADEVVRVSSSGQGDGFRVEPAQVRPAPEAVEFMQRFIEKYDETFRNIVHHKS